MAWPRIPSRIATAQAAGITTQPGCTTEARCKSSVSKMWVSDPSKKARRAASITAVSPAQRNRIAPGSLSRPANAFASASNVNSAACSRSVAATGLVAISSVNR